MAIGCPDVRVLEDGKRVARVLCEDFVPNGAPDVIALCVETNKQMKFTLEDWLELEELA